MTGDLSMSLSIKTKLIGAFVTVLLLTGALATVALTRLAIFNDALHHIVDVTAEKTRLAAQMETEFYAILSDQSAMLQEESLAGVEARHDDIKARIARLDDLRAEIGAIAEGPDVAAL
jgi:methyl-accepting chemotaxis protein